MEVASNTAVWYSTGLFAAPLRSEFWCAIGKKGSGSPAETDTDKSPTAFVKRLTDAVCYAA